MPITSGLFDAGQMAVGAGANLLDSNSGMRVQTAGQAASPPFSSVLSSALGEVNKLQSDAGAMVRDFALGGDVDVHQVMIAMEKASTAMQLTMQVRNKLVDAYQEIMRTPV